MKRSILGALLLLLPSAASAADTALEQLLIEYEGYPAATMPSHWECVCRCGEDKPNGNTSLENPETGDIWFYPGGTTKAECAKLDTTGHCMGLLPDGTTVRGVLLFCELTLVPDKG